MDKQIELYAQHYEELKDNLSELYIYKHDIKHKMLAALSELDLNQRDSIKKFDHLLDESLTYHFYSNHKSIDMILNYGANKAASLGIKAEIRVQQGLEVHIDDKELCVILGNLIDNSIEACEKYKQNYFVAELKNSNGNLFLKVENSYKGILEMRDGLPITTKDNKREHGKGLLSVERLVEANRGFMKVDTSACQFKVTILFPNVVLV